MIEGKEAELKATRQRLANLLEQVGEVPAEERFELPEVIKELRTVTLELQGAYEELHAQTDELLNVRQELESERLRYLELFDFAPDGYLTTTTEGMIIEANKAASRMVSVPQKFLPGKPLAMYVEMDDRQKLRKAITLASSSTDHNLTEVELHIKPSDGEMFDAGITITASKDKGGQVKTLRWMVRDITARKQAEEEIRRLNADLERRVRERTRDLENANLLKAELLVREQAAREEAERANRSKDEFLATFSHEMRTPLNAILGWIHIMRSRKSNEEVYAHAIDVIERNAMAQAQLVNDILEISRVITGKLRLEKRPAPLTSIVEAAIDSVRPLAEERRIFFSYSLPADEPIVMGDPTRLQQVVWNLLSNAVKFTHEGGRVEVNVTTSGGDAIITVTDSGRGISPEFLPHVFDRFSQGDSTPSRAQGGLGIGLALVRHFAEVHGGSVSATSEGDGKGSAFRVRLPLLGSTKGSEAEKAAAPPDHKYGELRLDRINILVVDDERDAREMLKVVLEQMGANVTIAGSCAEAIEAMKSQPLPPDVMVTDIAMPGEDGFDLIRQVRAMERPQLRDLPALALTAYASDEDRARVLSAGYQMHLAKPVSLTELTKAVVRLGGKPSQAQTQ